MKGRFRKGKKAFRGAIASPRQARFERQYQRWLLKKERQKRAAIRMVQAAMVAASGAMSVALIQGMINRSPQEKAISIAQQVINTAHSITAILSES